MTPTAKRETTGIRTIAEKGYLFGYPLMTMDMTRQVGANVPGPGRTQRISTGSARSGNSRTTRSEPS